MNDEFPEPSRITFDQQFGVLALPFENFGIDRLTLSKRPDKCLRRGGIFTLCQLLQTSPQKLLALRNMGIGSVEEVTAKLADLIKGEQEQASRQRQTEAALPQRTLLHQWVIFAGNNQFPDLNISELELEILVKTRLQSLDVESLGALLSWNWPELVGHLGYDDAETILSGIVALANESRYERPCARLETPPPAEIARMQYARWADAAIWNLNLSVTTLDFLTNVTENDTFPARLQTLSDLLDALDSPASSVFWSVSAYCEIWELGAQLGLRSGEALSHRKQLIQTTGQRPQMKMALDFARDICKPAEWEVTRLRFGLSGDLEMETLQNLSGHFRVSRERVRQRENGALKTLRKHALWRVLAENIGWLIEREGGVMSSQQLAQWLEANFDCGDVPAIHLVELLCQINAKLKRAARSNCPVPHGALAARDGPIYALPERAERFSEIIEAARQLWVERDDAIESEHWLGQLLERLAADAPTTDVPSNGPRFVMACLRADGRFDPDHFERVEPRLTLQAALVETLQRHGAPLHFTELTAKLNELGLWKREADEKNVYSRIGVHPELFVCVDRGTYGLFSWGLDAQRRTRDTGAPIAELATEFLEARGEPTHFSEIVEYVLERKPKSHDYSVLQRLSNDPVFHRFKHGIYGLKKWVF